MKVILIANLLTGSGGLANPKRPTKNMAGEFYRGSRIKDCVVRANHVQNHIVLRGLPTNRKIVLPPAFLHNGFQVVFFPLHKGDVR
mmetsp:Transcript_17067/g.28421  ORF Transcript_17067/g.28421 Transcript_17067/m.28421 type:complete len:86 (+) Transcript_17067:14-271(+)